MANYAVDAALAIALANTLFFAAATAESTGKVLLYLLITVAPFAVIAPLIGPALDRLQSGRRLALAASSFARAVLALIMVFQFDSWVLYPCALGMLVLSKSFGVLKAALTPRVLPDEITLVKTNSRLTVFGLIAGGVSGARRGRHWPGRSARPGRSVFTAIICVVGGVLCLRIPAWVESTAGEVPVNDSIQIARPGKRPSSPTNVITTLWANSTIRVETGFLALFIAFVVKSEFPDVGGFQQLLLLGSRRRRRRARRVHRQRPRRQAAARPAGDALDRRSRRRHRLHPGRGARARAWRPRRSSGSSDRRRRRWPRSVSTR